MKCKQPHFVVFRLMNEFYHASLAYILKLSLSVFILFARSFIRIEAIEIHSLFPWSLAKASGKQDKCEIDLIMLVSKTECYANIAPKMTEIILCASRHIRRMQSIHIILRQIERRQWISIPKIAAIRMLFNINDMFAFHTTFETNFRDSSSLSGQVIWNSMPGSCHPFISCHLKLHYIFPIACDRGIKYRYFCMLPVSVGQIYIRMPEIVASALHTRFTVEHSAKRELGKSCDVLHIRRENIWLNTRKDVYFHHRDRVRWQLTRCNWEWIQWIMPWRTNERYAAHIRGHHIKFTVNVSPRLKTNRLHKQ